MNALPYVSSKITSDLLDATIRLQQISNEPWGTVPINEIERRRGWMSRSNYIWSLLDGHTTLGPRRGPGVSRGEFEEFRQEMRRLVRGFMDFVVAMGLNPYAPPEFDEKRYPVNAKGNGTTNGASKRR